MCCFSRTHPSNLINLPGGYRGRYRHCWYQSWGGNMASQIWWWVQHMGSWGEKKSRSWTQGRHKSSSINISLQTRKWIEFTVSAGPSIVPAHSNKFPSLLGKADWSFDFSDTNTTFGVATHDAGRRRHLEEIVSYSRGITYVPDIPSRSWVH